MILRNPFARKSAGEAAADKVELARSLLDSGQLGAAMSVCQELLQVQPDQYEANCVAGEIAGKMASWHEALKFLSRAIELKPQQALAYYKRANVLRDCGRLEQSLEDYSAAVALNPAFAHAYCNRGTVLQHLHRPEEALKSYDRAVELNPDDALARFNRAGVLRELNRLEEAVENYEDALRVKPHFAECLCNLGLLQADLDRHEAALANYDRCIGINPDFVVAHFNRGLSLQSLERWQEAVASYNQVIELNPLHAEAYVNRGVVFMKMMRLADAMHDFDRASDLQPDLAAAHLNRGNLYAQLSSYRKAVESYDRAIQLKGNDAETHFNRADVLLQAGQYAAAVESYDVAHRINPNRLYLRGMRLHAQMYLCEWANVGIEIERLSEGLVEDLSAWPPLPLLTLVDDPELHFKCAQSWALNHGLLTENPPNKFAKRERQEKIRVGYFSGDFRMHPVSTLMAGVIESHDRSRFEVIGFSYGPHVQDDMRRRLEKAFDQFLDVSETSDHDVAALARDLKIDVAVDLAGYTGNGRTKIFAWRAAPVQVSYIGYLGTMAVPYMDYLVADSGIIPQEERHCYAEKIIYLPSYQANDSKRRISETVYARDQLGLPQNGFVFACFNANHKITPAMFSSWMRILLRVEASVLYLYAGNATAETNIRREAEKRGVDPRRIVFGQKLGFEEYLARYRVMDLFLDTLPYNAGATASDALWAGLPVLTCAGRAFAGRVAASLLTAIDMPELITHSSTQYEDLAVKLATTPALMAGIRKKLAVNRIGTALFDTEVFTNDLEAAYAEIVERNRYGLPPEDTYVRLNAPSAALE
jgi:predicted O-linked N-acetylglucosamine transferase (SPINDLY family)